MADGTFRERLGHGAVVFDGGMGTMLYEKGVFINRCFDELNLSEPALVRAIHGEYVRAGVDVIETNTFGANAVKLEAHGFRDNLAEINYKGAKIARAAASDRALVAGSIGPLGIKIEPWGPTSIDEAKGLFREQAQALLEGGVDLVVLETFSDINEIQQAIRAVRELDPGIAIVAQMTLGEDGNSLYGTAPEVFGQRLEQWGADVVGINCSVGPAIMLDAVERLVRAVKRPLSVQPNAGLPRSVDGRNIYLASADYMASYARRFVASGAAVVGGCCGTTPDHLRAIVKAVKGTAAGATATAAAGAARGAPAAEIAATPIARRDKSRLAALLEQRRFAVAAEVRPPRGLDPTSVLDGVTRLKAAGVELVHVREGRRAAPRMSPAALALLVERKVGVETLFHYTCRDRNLLGMQSDLMGTYALGLRNVVCETGGGTEYGESVAPTPVFDVDSIGLTNMLHRLNQGLDVGGSALGSPTGWLIGVVANPTAIDLDQEVRRFEWKVDAGAEFCLTPPVFDLDPLHRFLQRTAGKRIPLLLGIQPLLSFSEAEYLSNEVPGCRVPPHVLERMRRASERSEEHARAEGVAIARELLLEARSLVQGAVVAVSHDRYDAAAEVAAAASGIGG